MHHRPLIAAVLISLMLSTACPAGEGRQVLTFNGGWRFSRIEKVSAPEAFKPDPADLASEGEFPAGLAAPEVHFSKRQARYVCLEALSSQAGDPFTSLAELDVLGEDGKPLPRDGWSVAYVDSEQPGDVATNVLDGNPQTIWHTRYSDAKPPHPHALVIDMQKVTEIGGFRALPRPSGGPGVVKQYRFYTRPAAFALPGDPALAGPTFEADAVDDAAWDAVTLPHTPRVEELYQNHPWQGISWYRKTFAADPAWKSKKVFLEFGAAMQIADVWVNGALKAHHLGGYMKFQIDLTDSLRFDRHNVVAVRLDNRDTPLCPPGKPTNDLDFNYPGGLYRGATLIITSPLHVSDAVAANIEAGGGVFVTCDDVSADSAAVNIKTHVVNETGGLARSCQVVSTLLDAEGKTVAEFSNIPVLIATGEGHHFLAALKIAHPRLWDPDHPSLYTLKTAVLDNGQIVDELQTRIGIRHLAISKRLLLNGQVIEILGSNRHQEYPYVGYALSPQAARRDAVKIKEAGLNFIRLSHYPHDPAFLDACDELGIMVQAPIPGWQKFWATASFIQHSYQDTRDLVHRDRNHPCVVFWEPNLNETSEQPVEFCRAQYEICHAEYPGDQCLTFGDPYPKKPGWDWDVRSFAREYGDFGFGGNESTSRHLRGEGEKAMLQQTWNFLWCLNDMSRGYANPHAEWLGCATWCMFDYTRGYYPKPCTCGMMDIFRLPKYEYFFFQSQRDPRIVRTDIGSGPTVFIASQWSAQPSPAKVVIFSNCEEVELKLNGKTLRRQKPDTGPDTRYSGKRDVSYETVGTDYNITGGNPFDGGNCTHLGHPPFTFFDVPYEPGLLEATGFIAGREAARYSVRTPEAPVSLKVVIDTARTDLVATGSDVVFARALVLDRNGAVVSGDSSSMVQFQAGGPAQFIGRNPMPAEAGIASIILKAGGTPGVIRLSATSDGLKGDTQSITSKAVQ